MMYFVVKYSGPFGFIKPWTAVRDIETFSQQFLTPSIVEGMEKKLFPELMEVTGIQKIKRHRLSYDQMSEQQEQIQPRGWNKKKDYSHRAYAVLIRNIMLNPVLVLAFDNLEDAILANKQHICLCRNEDILYPTLSAPLAVTQEEFETDDEFFSGFELMFEDNDQSFLVGYNRFNDGKPMYGWLHIVGNPINVIV